MYLLALLNTPEGYNITPTLAGVDQKQEMEEVTGSNRLLASLTVTRDDQTLPYPSIT